MGRVIGGRDEGLRRDERNPGARHLAVNQAGIDAGEDGVHGAAGNLLGSRNLDRLGLCGLRLGGLGGRRLVRILEGANTLGAGLVRLGDQGLEGCALASGGGNNLDEHRYVDAGDDIHALAGGRELRTGVVGAATEEVNEQQGFFCLGRLNDAGVLFDEIFGALARQEGDRVDVFEVTEDHAGGLQQSRGRLAVCRHNDGDHNGPLVCVLGVCYEPCSGPCNPRMVAFSVFVLWVFSRMRTLGFRDVFIGVGIWVSGLQNAYF